MDFDGVVNDSFQEGLRRIRNLCAIHEIPFGPRERKTLTELWGLPGVDLFVRTFDITQKRAERIYKEWERLDLADPVPLVNGAREALFWLRRNAFKTGLLTSRNRQNIVDIFEEIDLMREFTVLCTKQESPYHKPDPRVFAYALSEFESYGITKDECIFVGDTFADMEAGSQAGISTILVQTGPYLLRHAHDLPIPLANVLGSIDDLPLWIEENHESPIDHSYI